MKTRNGFVSNSSSTAFIIKNRTKERKTLVDFVRENPRLIEMFREEYGHTENDGYTQDALIESASARNMAFEAKEKKYCPFGDEDGDLVGEVFDYILRGGGESPSFAWRFEEWLR